MESYFIEVPKASGERVRRYLGDQNLLDRRLRIKSTEKSLKIPITNVPDDTQSDKINEITGCRVQVDRGDFERVARKLTIEDIIGLKPSFEVLGDIAVMLPPGDVAINDAADAILRVNKGIRTVVIPKTPVSGEYRVRTFEWVGGAPIHEIELREYGNRFRFDIRKVYFTPRLATERQRVASQVGSDELVVDMFAGVGPYTIPVAKRARRVIAIDINPDATHYLMKNLSLNRIENVEVRTGDVREIAPELANVADRAIMNLPLQAFEFLDAALTIIKHGGVVHFYDIRQDNDLFGGLIRKLERKVGGIRILHRGVVRSYAPHLYNVVVDFIPTSSSKA
ncbi:MAG: SAM-dependent methyltransferase [Candidatus Syntrophoarchaeum caldarius]|uniref:SAM-dependent methyltransferase n=1 Tax=Candidatus Syntropharchaeum caldarium TaxID=1838285 RepID=A0A1F2PBW6_9EURY|nr:MAG: SAM-dependent methyltransferase [Candidatus Syntrophoarchaeum caldarius]